MIYKSYRGSRAVDCCCMVPIPSAGQQSSDIAKMGDESSDVDEERTGGAVSDTGSESDLDGRVEEGLQEQVAEIPFEDLQKARSDGGLAHFSRAKQNVDTKRANKNRPMEVTSKKPVPRFRDVMQAPKKMIRDPRFESLCGDYDESKFKSAYSFLYNEQLPSERQNLRTALQKKKGNVEVQSSLTMIDKQLKEEGERRKKATKATQHKANEEQAVKRGKIPYYQKKSEIRKEQLVEKFKELKSSGKLEKYMEKRRRKNAAKDHRFVPYRRIVH